MSVLKEIFSKGEYRDGVYYDAPLKKQEEELPRVQQRPTDAPVKIADIPKTKD